MSKPQKEINVGTLTDYMMVRGAPLPCLGRRVSFQRESPCRASETLTGPPSPRTGRDDACPWLQGVPGASRGEVPPPHAASKAPFQLPASSHTMSSLRTLTSRSSRPLTTTRWFRRRSTAEVRSRNRSARKMKPPRGTRANASISIAPQYSASDYLQLCDAAILETMVRGRSRDDVQYIFIQLSERLKRATEWLVSAVERTDRAHRRSRASWLRNHKIMNRHRFRRVLAGCAQVPHGRPPHPPRDRRQYSRRAREDAEETGTCLLDPRLLRSPQPWSPPPDRLCAAPGCPVLARRLPGPRQLPPAAPRLPRAPLRSAPPRAKLPEVPSNLALPTLRPLQPRRAPPAAAPASTCSTSATSATPPAPRRAPLTPHTHPSQQLLSSPRTIHLNFRFFYLSPGLGALGPPPHLRPLPRGARRVLRGHGLRPGQRAHRQRHHP